MEKDKTIIIGGGPAGLTAAYELNKIGKKAIILEAGSQVGGISKTVNYEGNRFDIGGHRFFSKHVYVNEIWEHILGGDLLIRERMSRIHYNGHFFDYPLKPLNALKGLGLGKSVGVIGSYLHSSISPIRNPENFEDWVKNQFGEKLYEIFFKTYTEKVWGMPCHEISADWASQRIKNFSLKEAISNAFSLSGKNGNGAVITTLIEQFKYPRLGPGMMWEVCQKQLEDNGSPTLLNEKVTSIEHRNGKVKKINSLNKKGEKTTYTADHFISSMPLRELVLSLSPAPPNQVVEAARKLRYRDYLTVVLVLKQKEIFPDNWIYIHTPEVKLGRIQNYKNWSPEMVANPIHTTLGLEYFLWEKDEEWNWSDEKLIQLGIEECQKVGLIKKSDVVDATVVKMKKAYPVYDRNYSINVNVIRNYLGGFQNLQTIGRNGLHRYNNQDHSMMTGVFAARNTVGEKNDVWSVNTEAEYHESGENRISERLIPSKKY